MLFVIIIFSSILLLLTAIYFVGLLLPKKRILTKETIFDAPIEKVYNTVINNIDWQYRTGLDDLKILETNGEFEIWEENSNGYTISFKTIKKNTLSILFI